MNQHFARHTVWQLWNKLDVIPPRPPGWAAPVKAFFRFEVPEVGEKTVEVWAAPIENGKVPIGAWTYDVKSGGVKMFGHNRSLEMGQGWPSDADGAREGAPSETATQEESATCPVCALALPVVLWRGTWCFPGHEGSNGNDCNASYQPIDGVFIHGELITKGHRGKFEGFEKIEELVPQTAGEAVMLYPFLEHHPGHEWDNRTTAENAAWLIGQLVIRARSKKDLAEPVLLVALIKQKLLNEKKTNETLSRLRAVEGEIEARGKGTATSDRRRKPK